MNQNEIMQSIVVQGTLLESDTKYYVELLNNDQLTVEYSDPVKRTIASVFRMCLQGNINPWDIDLTAFVNIFSEMVDEKFRDFSAAGYLIYQAWKILNEKTRDSLQRRLISDSPDELTEMESHEEIFQDPLELSLKEPIKHHETRKVYLVELLDAMREAYKISSHPSRRREILQVEHASTSIEEIVQELHAEEPEKEIMRVYEILLSREIDGLMEDIWVNSEFSRASFFVYCMFLMREKKIMLSQEIPYGAIRIEKPN